MNGRIVSDTGPLIALAIIEHLDILKILFNEVIVPQAVHDEVLQGGPDNIGVDLYRNSSWIHIRQLSNPLEPLLSNVLDAGEACVIQLARECGANFVLMDEPKGRKIAREIYKLRVVGTARILVEGKRRRIIPSVRDAIMDMRNGGYRIGDNILEFALKKSGET